MGKKCFYGINSRGGRKLVKRVSILYFEFGGDFFCIYRVRILLSKFIVRRTKRAFTFVTYARKVYYKLDKEANLTGGDKADSISTGAIFLTVLFFDHIGAKREKP